MKAKLIKVDDIYRLLKEDDFHEFKLIIGTTDEEYQKAFSDNCYPLSLKNCQAIERGYDLDELADDFICCPEDMRTLSEDREINSFKKGFQKALELNNTKLYTLEDMMNCWNKALKFQEHKETLGEYIQSLQQTEWDVEFEMEYVGECNGNNDNGCFQDSPGHNCGCFERKPKLDDEGCLILKRI